MQTTQAKSQLKTHLDHYEAQGFTILNSVFDKTLCEKLKDDCMQACDKQGRQPSGVNVIYGNELSPIIRDVLCTGPIAELTKALLGPETEFLSYKPVYKDGTTTFATPWHQDWSYWGGPHKLSVWIALDDATVNNGCLKVIPGSHKTVVEHDVAQSEKGFVNRLDESLLDQEKIVDVELPAGSALFFHDLLLHASHENHSGEDRWSLIPTYRSSAAEDLAAEDNPDRGNWKHPITL